MLLDDVGLEWDPYTWTNQPGLMEDREETRSLQNTTQVSSLWTLHMVAVLAGSGCNNKMACAGCLQPQGFMGSQFWGWEVPCEGPAGWFLVRIFLLVYRQCLLNMVSHVGQIESAALTYTHCHVWNRQLVGSCAVARGAQPDSLRWPRGVDGGGVEGERLKREGILMTDS